MIPGFRFVRRNTRTRVRRAQPAAKSSCRIEIACLRPLPKKFLIRILIARAATLVFVTDVPRLLQSKKLLSEGNASFLTASMCRVKSWYLSGDFTFEATYDGVNVKLVSSPSTYFVTWQM